MIRYPGGKSRLYKRLQTIGLSDKFFKGETRLLSPFCGGASLEFQLLPQLNRLHLVDKNPGMHDVCGCARAADLTIRIVFYLVHLFS